MEQFIKEAPEPLAVWLRECKPRSLQQAAEMADDYATARKGEDWLRLYSEAHSPASAPTDRRPTSQTGGEGRKPWTQPTQQVQPPSRSKTNEKGEKRCFKYQGWEHLSYNCPKMQGGTVDVKVNSFYGRTGERTNEFGQQGTLDNRPLDVLIDTGSDRTMVAAEVIDPSLVNWENKAAVLCVHGDTVHYPTARVELRAGGWTGEREVIVVPRLPAGVLLGLDVVCQGSDPGDGRGQDRRGKEASRLTKMKERDKTEAAT